MYESPIFLINKAGIFSFFDHEYNTEKPFSIIDYFPYQVTSSGFYKTDLGVLIRFYQNTIFTENTEQTAAPSLCKYEPVTGGFKPILSARNFGLPPYAQLVNFSYSGKWYACFKTEKNGKVEFDYFSFKKIIDVENAGYKKISADSFRRNTAPIILSEAVLKNMESSGENGFSALANEVEEGSIKIEYCSSDWESSKTYIKNKNNFSSEYIADTEYEAFAVKCRNKGEGEITEAILLNTGKLYANIKGGGSVIKLLPELPKGFVYTYFASYGNFILAGWEEQDFFRVGRSGFIVYNFNAERR